MIRLCIFDLDGTLINSLVDLANATNYALVRSGFPKRETGEYILFLGEGLQQLLQYAAGDELNIETSRQLAADFACYYNSHYADHTRPYEGIFELLNHLQAENIKIAVLSNKPEEFVKIIVGHLFNQIVFSAIQGNTDDFPRKPDPASLKHILEELNIKPEETVYIGDSDIDVYTGQNAGVQVIGVTWGFRKREELESANADYIVDSPQEIWTLVQTRNAI